MPSALIGSSAAVSPALTGQASKAIAGALRTDGNCEHHFEFYDQTYARNGNKDDKLSNILLCSSGLWDQNGFILHKGAGCREA